MLPVATAWLALATPSCAQYAGSNGFVGYLALAGLGNQIVTPELLSFGVASPAVSGTLAGRYGFARPAGRQQRERARAHFSL